MLDREQKKEWTLKTTIWVGILMVLLSTGCAKKYDGKTVGKWKKGLKSENSEEQAVAVAALAKIGQETQHVQMWSPYLEWELSSPSVTGNPYDVVATVTFSHEDGETSRTTELFFAGENTWRFRFTGTKLGDWRFRTRSDDPELDGHTGNVTVRPNPDPNARGFLTHAGSQYAIQAGNDARLRAYPFAVFMDGVKHPTNEFTTWDEEAIAAYCRNAKDNGFAIIFVSVNNQWVKKGALSWNDHDSENPDLETFQQLEQIILTAYKMGCRVHFWAWGDEARKWTPRGLPGGINGEADRRLQRYIAARLGPLPGWTMGYGFDLHEWVSEEQLNSWAEYLHEHMGWQHLLSARGVPLRGKNNIRSYDGFGRSISVGTTRCGPKDYWEIVEDMADDTEHPHLYEERHSYRRRGFKLDMDGTRRLLWRETMAGGMGGFFGFYAMDSSAANGYPYPNPEQLRTHYAFWHQQQRLRLGMKPDNSLAGNGFALKDPSNRYSIFYVEDADTVQMDLTKMETAQPAVAVDTKQKYKELALGALSTEKHTWKAPYSSDWVIVITP